MKSSHTVSPNPFRRLAAPLILALVFIGGCADKPTSRHYSTYGIGTPSNLRAAEAAQAYMSAANPLLEQRRSDKPVRLIRAPQPVMPPQAIDDRIEGEVKIRIIFDETGKVGTVEVVESPHQLLTQAVLQAVKQWAITPATVNGKPEKTVVRQAFVFKAEAER